MTREAINELKKYTLGKKNTEKVEISVLQLNRVIKALEQEPILDKIRAEIKAKIEEEEFARSVFRHEEKDAVKAEQCTGSIMAYNNLIKLIDKYKAGVRTHE